MSVKIKQARKELIWSRFHSPTYFETCLDETLRHLRINRGCFHYLIDYIKDHDIFDTTNSNRQLSIQSQLLLFLRFISESNRSPDGIYQDLKLGERNSLGFTACIERISRALLFYKPNYSVTNSDYRGRELTYFLTACDDNMGDVFTFKTIVSEVGDIFIIIDSKPNVASTIEGREVDHDDTTAHFTFQKFYSRFNRLQSQTINLNSSRFLRAQKRWYYNLIQSAIILNNLIRSYQDGNC